MANGQNFKWLRSLGVAGSFFANGLQLLGLNIGVTVSALLAIAAAVWSAATGFVLSPPVAVGAAVFLALLWTWIGVVYLRDRHKPREVRAHQDYRYGLTFEGMVPLWNPKGEEGALQFGLQFRNYSQGPVRYTVETFDVRIGTRSLPRLKKGELVSYLPRGAGRLSRNVPFQKHDIQEFLGKSVVCAVEVVVSYGHPESAPVRQLSMQIEITLTFPAADSENQNLGFADRITEERDEPYMKMVPG